MAPGRGGPDRHFNRRASSLSLIRRLINGSPFGRLVEVSCRVFSGIEPGYLCPSPRSAKPSENLTRLLRVLDESFSDLHYRNLTPLSLEGPLFASLGSPSSIATSGRGSTSAAADFRRNACAVGKQLALLGDELGSRCARHVEVSANRLRRMPTSPLLMYGRERLYQRYGLAEPGVKLISVFKLTIFFGATLCDRMAIGGRS
jgi:hypothetical protein